MGLLVAAILAAVVFGSMWYSGVLFRKMVPETRISPATMLAISAANAIYAFVLVLILLLFPPLLPAAIVFFAVAFLVTALVGRYVTTANTKANSKAGE
jgi:hypothetical protein